MSAPHAGALLLTLALAVEPAEVAEGDGAARLEQLRREAAAVEAAAGRLAGRERSLLGELAVLGTRRDLAAAERAAAEEQLATGRQALAEAERRAADAERRERAALAALAARLRALERTGSASTLKAVLLASDPEAVVAGLREVSSRARRDARLAERARGLAARVEEVRRDLEIRQAAAAAASDRAVAAGAAAAEAGQVLGARLVEVRGRRELYTRAVAEMTRATAELDDFIGGRAVTAPAGPAMSARRGTLPWPVPGELRVPFGPRRNARFGTVLPHNGVTLDGVPGEPVRAIAAGTVVWAEWFEGFGRTVIVDHGDGVMTVAAHLASLPVATGRSVAAGEPVGEIGDSASLEGAGLYFEIRVGGQPVDPLHWLAPRGLLGP